MTDTANALLAVTSLFIRGRLQLFLPARHLRRQLRQRLPPYAPAPSTLPLSLLVCSLILWRRCAYARGQSAPWATTRPRAASPPAPGARRASSPACPVKRPASVRPHALRCPALSNHMHSRSRWYSVLAVLHVPNAQRAASVPPATTARMASAIVCTAPAWTAPPLARTRHHSRVSLSARAVYLPMNSLPRRPVQHQHG